MYVAKFLSNLSSLTTEEVVILSVSHMLGKKFDKDTRYLQSDFVDFLSDYTNYTKYLNDFMSVVCKQYNTDTDSIYEFVCDVLDVESDNKSLFDFRLKRLLFNTPQRVLSIVNDDIKEHNLEHMEEEFNILIASRYYLSNKLDYQSEISNIIQNIEIIKQNINQK